MAMERRQSELPMLSKKFGSDYFSRRYRESDDKNPVGKMETYLSIIRRYFHQSKRDCHVPPKAGLAMTGNAKLASLLDIGCGYGRFLKAAETEFETYGIDPSEFVISQAEKYAVNTKLEVATILSYKPKKLFNVITAFDVLEHISDVEKAILRLKIWLKPGGIFFCAVPVYDGPLGWIAGKLDQDETHINKWSRQKWTGLFSKNFRVLETWGAVRYSFGHFGYFHFSAPWLFPWGQAILVVMRK